MRLMGFVLLDKRRFHHDNHVKMPTLTSKMRLLKIIQNISIKGGKLQVKKY